MPHVSLYRRYRPQKFGEVRGQEPVVRALQNAAREERVGHAYLFSGPRGTGKTSTARILAKVLNCTAPADGEPCGVCDSCRGIEAGTSMDVHELDAASNNGVEAIRDLIGKTILGTPGRTKVYILDEVHMLSPAASNALLKTLEEPPGHVVFILATTDPQKVLPTIKSRTQHFEFGLLGADELAEHLRFVVDDAGLEVTPDAIDQVLKEGAGSARDALSALDRVVAGGGTAEATEPVDQLLEALCERDTGAILVNLAAEIRRGRDPRIIGEALLGRLRDAFLAAMEADLSHLPDTQRGVVTGFAERLGPAAITRALESLGEALVEMRQAPDARIPLEVALVRLTRADSDLSPAALLERIERLERRSAAPGPADEPSPTKASPPKPSSKGGAAAAAGSPAEAGREALARAETVAPEPAQQPRPALGARRRDPAPEAPSPPPAPAAEGAATASNGGAGFPDRDELTLVWGDVLLDRLPARAKARFKGGRFTAVRDGKAVFALPNQIHRDRCQDFKAEVEGVLATHFGRPIPLDLVVDEGATPPDAPPVATPPAPGETKVEDDTEDDEVVDVSELEDAVGQDQSAVAQLAETFGDVEVIEEEP